jgi:hypothetical protein
MRRLESRASLRSVEACPSLFFASGVLVPTHWPQRRMSLGQYLPMRSLTSGCGKPTGGRKLLHPLSRHAEILSDLILAPTPPL